MNTAVSPWWLGLQLGVNTAVSPWWLGLQLGVNTAVSPWWLGLQLGVNAAVSPWGWAMSTEGQSLRPCLRLPSVKTACCGLVRSRAPTRNSTRSTSAVFSNQ